MSEQKLSVSFRLEDGLLDHNNRKVIAKNVDVTRIPDDIFYRQTDLREFYGQLFDEALAEYNSTKRPYLRIENYYDHIESGRQEKLFNEVVVQFGDRLTCGIFSKDKGNWDLAKELLDEYMRGFEERNPNMKVFNAALHADEDTPHLHIDFVPVCYNQKRGLSTRVSMRRALAEQGFTPSNKMQNELVAWEKSEMEYMTTLLHSRGIERDVSQEKEDLARVRELMKVYNIVVEGNFIDNLVKAENERKELEANIEAERKRQADIEAKRKAMQQQTLQKKEAEKAAAPVPAPKPEQEKPIQQPAPQIKKKTGHRR